MICIEQYDQIQLHSSRKPKKIGVTWKGLDKMEIIKPPLYISESDYG
jgi:hypothetical protein